MSGIINHTKDKDKKVIGIKVDYPKIKEPSTTQKIASRHAKTLKRDFIETFKGNGGKISLKNFNKIYYLHFSRALKEVFEAKGKKDKVYELLKNGEINLYEHPEVKDIVNEFELAIEACFKEAGLSKDRSKGQLPDFAFASNVELNLEAIFYDFTPMVEGKIQKGGVFGNSIAIRKDKHLEEEEDFTQFAYILNHNSHEKKPIPFFMFITDKSSNGYLKLIIKRREKLLNYAKNAGWRIEEDRDNDYYIVKKIEGELKKTLIPVVVYDAKIGEFKVYHTRGERAGSYEKLEDWIERNKNIIGEKLAVHLTRRLRRHIGDPYSSHVFKLRRLYQKVACVDARHNPRGVAELLKELGSIPKDEEIRRMFRHNFTNLISIELHTTCGYITSSVGFHDLFEWVSKKGSKSLKEAMLRQINNFIESSKNGKEYRMVLSEEYDVEMEKAGKDIENAYRVLFRNDKGDFQFILKHMIEVGLFSFDGNELPKMKVVERVDRRKNYGKDKTYRVFLVTEEIARWLKQRIEGIREEEIRKGNENASKVEVNIVIRSLVNDELIIPPRVEEESYERRVLGGEGYYTIQDVRKLI